MHFTYFTNVRFFHVIFFAYGALQKTSPEFLRKSEERQSSENQWTPDVSHMSKNIRGGKIKNKSFFHFCVLNVSSELGLRLTEIDNILVDHHEGSSGAGAHSRRGLTTIIAGSRVELVRQRRQEFFLGLPPFFPFLLRVRRGFIIFPRLFFFLLMISHI